MTDLDPDLTAFLEKGCGCKRNAGKSCYTAFSREHYEGVRMQCAELNRSELDLVLLGQISALLTNKKDTNAHRPSTPRQRSSMAFYHAGVRICRVTFQKLHGIGSNYLIHNTL